MKRLVMICVMLLSVVRLTVAQEQEDGYTKYYHANGLVSSEGTLVDGKPEGWWKTYYESGILRSEGGRKQFQLDSLWRFYSANGKLQTETFYRADRKEGLARRFDTTGTLLSEENYVADLREGVAHYFHENGSLYQEIPFKAGKEEGRGYEYATDGRVVSILHYGAGMLRKREDINRADAMGLRQGQWKEFHPNGKVRLEGNYVDDRKQGIFKEYDALGNLKDMVKYDGGMVDEGAGEMLTVEIKRTFHPNGRVASLGSYSKSGKREGLFKEFSTDGVVSSAKVYKGDQLISEGLVNYLGMMEGPWVEFYATGEKRAEGAYKEGRKEGDWTFYHRSGKVEQKGKYMNGSAQGTWKWFYEDGTLHREELYRKGREDGASAEYDEKGVVITKGEYIDGRKEGEWMYAVGDHREAGAYKGGLKDGAWIYTYDTGKKYFTGDFVDGEPNGKHRWYWPNGQLKLEGRYAMGLEQGDFTHHAIDGAITLVIKFRDGAEVRIDGGRVPPPYEPGADQP
ncbi:MAG: toxin-antitoxin system YwqK family antitoxin [Flavobacteriales bacterium]|nr:toxin-antitoxin system YwqK family antitoxin [Flavobacteriales bacterium]